MPKMLNKPRAICIGRQASSAAARRPGARQRPIRPLHLAEQLRRPHRLAARCSSGVMSGWSLCPAERPRGHDRRAARAVAVGRCWRFSGCGHGRITLAHSRLCSPALDPPSPSGSIAPSSPSPSIISRLSRRRRLFGSTEVTAAGPVIFASFRPFRFARLVAVGRGDAIGARSSTESTAAPIVAVMMKLTNNPRVMGSFTLLPWFRIVGWINGVGHELLRRGAVRGTLLL